MQQGMSDDLHGGTDVGEQDNVMEIMDEQHSSFPDDSSTLAAVTSAASASSGFGGENVASDVSHGREFLDCLDGMPANADSESGLFFPAAPGLVNSAARSNDRADSDATMTDGTAYAADEHLSSDIDEEDDDIPLKSLFKQPTNAEKEFLCEGCFQKDIFTSLTCVSCDKCSIKAHFACVGVTKMQASGGWICGSCHMKNMGNEPNSNAQHCCICEKVHGLRILCKSQGIAERENGSLLSDVLVHPFCALALEECFWTDGRVGGTLVASLPKRARELCNICLVRSRGSLLRCGEQDCRRKMHAFCAGQAGKASLFLLNGRRVVRAHCSEEHRDFNEEIFCHCKSKWDFDTFGVNCDSCEGWFHGPCIGLSERKAEELESWQCNECQSKAKLDEDSNSDEKHNCRLYECYEAFTPVVRNEWFVYPTSPSLMPGHTKPTLELAQHPKKLSRHRLAFVLADLATLFFRTSERNYTTSSDESPSFMQPDFSGSVCLGCGGSCEGPVPIFMASFLTGSLCFNCTCTREQLLQFLFKSSSFAINSSNFSLCPEPLKKKAHQSLPSLERTLSSLSLMAQGGPHRKEAKEFFRLLESASCAQVTNDSSDWAGFQDAVFVNTAQCMQAKLSLIHNMIAALSNGQPSQHAGYQPLQLIRLARRFWVQIDGEEMAAKECSELVEWVSRCAELLRIRPDIAELELHVSKGKELGFVGEELFQAENMVSFAHQWRLEALQALEENDTLLLRRVSKRSTHVRVRMLEMSQIENALLKRQASGLLEDHQDGLSLSEMEMLMNSGMELTDEERSALHNSLQRCRSWQRNVRALIRNHGTLENAMNLQREHNASRWSCPESQVLNQQIELAQKFVKKWGNSISQVCVESKLQCLSEYDVFPLSVARFGKKTSVNSNKNKLIGAIRKILRTPGHRATLSEAQHLLEITSSEIRNKDVADLRKAVEQCQTWQVAAKAAADSGDHETLVQLSEIEPELRLECELANTVAMTAWETRVLNALRLEECADDDTLSRKIGCLVLLRWPELLALISTGENIVASLKSPSSATCDDGKSPRICALLHRLKDAADQRSREFQCLFAAPSSDKLREVLEQIQKQFKNDRRTLPQQFQLEMLAQCEQLVTCLVNQIHVDSSTLPKRLAVQAALSWITTAPTTVTKLEMKCTAILPSFKCDWTSHSIEAFQPASTQTECALLPCIPAVALQSRRIICDISCQVDSMNRRRLPKFPLCILSHKIPELLKIFQQAFHSSLKSVCMFSNCSAQAWSADGFCSCDCAFKAFITNWKSKVSSSKSPEQARVETRAAVARAFQSCMLCSIWRPSMIETEEIQRCLRDMSSLLEGSLANLHPSLDNGYKASVKRVFYTIRRHLDLNATGDVKELRTSLVSQINEVIGAESHKCEADQSEEEDNTAAAKPLPAVNLVLKSQKRVSFSQDNGASQESSPPRKIARENDPHDTSTASHPKKQASTRYDRQFFVQLSSEQENPPNQQIQKCKIRCVVPQQTFFKTPKSVEKSGSIDVLKMIEFAQMILKSSSRRAVLFALFPTSAVKKDINRLDEGGKCVVVEVSKKTTLYLCKAERAALIREGWNSEDTSKYSVVAVLERQVFKPYPACHVKQQSQTEQEESVGELAPQQREVASSSQPLDEDEDVVMDYDDPDVTESGFSPSPSGAETVSEQANGAEQPPCPALPARSSAALQSGPVDIAATLDSLSSIFE